MWSSLKRLFGSKEAETKTPGQEETPTLEDELREYLRQRLRSGFVTVAEAVENALDTFEEEEVAESTARRIATEELSALLAEAKTWTAPTDNDRFDAAFAALEERGIVARQDWTCCQTCGTDAIADEIADARNEGRDVRGYTYFHEQDTESAVEGFGVMLAYGPAVESLNPVAIGREIVEVFRNHGFAPEWSGDARQRILVPLVWRRLPVEEEQASS